MWDCLYALPCPDNGCARLCDGADKGFVNLEMQKTLEENGLKDESEELSALGIDEDEFMPILHIYFDDDLTFA